MLKIFDRANGVTGNYCIGKQNGIYWSFWNKDHWSGCGEVFTSLKAAKKKMRKLNG